MKSLPSLAEAAEVCLTAMSSTLTHTHTHTHTYTRGSHVCNASHWQWPQCESCVFIYKNTCTHTVVRLCRRAAGEWRCSGFEHWLSVLAQVNPFHHSAQQQQTLNGALVWAGLRSAGRAAAQIIWSETCCYGSLSWICRYCLHCDFFGGGGLMHAVFQQHSPSRIVVESVTHAHTWRLHSTATVSLAELCESCRGLIALLKGIAVINIDREKSVSHLLSVCRDHL